MGSGPTGNLSLHINISYCMLLMCLQVVNKRSPYVSKWKVKLIFRGTNCCCITLHIIHTNTLVTVIRVGEHNCIVIMILIKFTSSRRKTCTKMEGKTNFSRNLKQFDGLTQLTWPPYFTTDLYVTVHGQWFTVQLLNKSTQSS